MDFGHNISSNKEECLPLKSLTRLKTWNEENIHNTFPLQKRSFPEYFRTKILVCHDMKGGYLEDRFHHGSDTEHNYFFTHWSMIDIFVYFSHNLVTIPPCSWISAAHRNGVRILGTFITEWDSGAQIWDSILCDIESVYKICYQLVNIANSRQFDGWLINVENEIEADKVLLLKEFVKILTIEMHKSRKDSLVIWYDSVIRTGELKWQNELNESNRDFFDICDGIFLNYNWDRQKLKKSYERAGSRNRDVFVGVDVFGRGCPGGGGYFTDTAVRTATENELSVAIFAPGWVYECHNKLGFKVNQNKFWSTLVELCNVRSTETLPYRSSFCPGFGKKHFRQGKVISDKPWYNISLQQMQASYHFSNRPANLSTINIYNDDAFDGGGCLQLTTKVERFTRARFDVLKTNFTIKAPCRISYTFKSSDKYMKVILIVKICKYLSEIPNIPTMICTKYFMPETDEHKGGSLNFGEDPYVYPTSTEIFEGLDEKMPWIKRIYQVDCNVSCTIKSFRFELDLSKATRFETYILLGELQVLPAENYDFRYKDLVEYIDEHSIGIECLLEWNARRDIDFYDLYVLSNGVKKHICTTTQSSYKFKSTISKASQIEFFLIPFERGHMHIPNVVKIPLDNKFPHSM